MCELQDSQLSHQIYRATHRRSLRRVRRTNFLRVPARSFDLGASPGAERRGDSMATPLPVTSRGDGGTACPGAQHPTDYFHFKAKHAQLGVESACRCQGVPGKRQGFLPASAAGPSRFSSDENVRKHKARRAQPHPPQQRLRHFGCGVMTPIPVDSRASVAPRASTAKRVQNCRAVLFFNFRVSTFSASARSSGVCLLR